MLIRFISKKVLYHLSLDKPVVYDGTDLLWMWREGGEAVVKTDFRNVALVGVHWRLVTSMKGYGILAKAEERVK